jgi:hypothetical protein
VTTADVLFYRDYVLLFCGGLSAGHESIGMAMVRRKVFRGSNFGEWAPNPIVERGHKGDFDSEHVTDPSSIVVGRRVYLYYSGIGYNGDWIGLATSEDGKTFRKSNANPVLKGRAPEIVRHAGLYFLYFVLPNEEGGYTIFSAPSEDGLDFSMHQARPILEPTPGTWDGYSVTTPRVFEIDGRYAMVYAGSDEAVDSPKSFGLAYSEDLIHWSKCKMNPIFHKGPTDSWDDLAIWFGTVYGWGEDLYMLYEGCARQPLKASPLSQIGLAAVMMRHAANA